MAIKRSPSSLDYHHADHGFSGSFEILSCLLRPVLWCVDGVATFYAFIAKLNLITGV